MALVDQIISAESGGVATARNPRSTAEGPGQFIDSTWLAMLSKHRPDLVAGKTPQELLALKTDVPLATEMTTALAADNAGILSGNGLPVTPGTTYLAHFAGPQGAIGILNADPTAPAGSILGPRVVAANPFLKDMTAADLRSWADRKMGVPNEAPAPFSMSGPAPSTAPTVIPSGISDNPAEESSSRVHAFAGLRALPDEQPVGPPPLLLPPRARIDLSRLRPQAPASSRDFAFRGR